MYATGRNIQASCSNWVGALSRPCIFFREKTEGIANILDIAYLDFNPGLSSFFCYSLFADYANLKYICISFRFRQIHLFADLSAFHVCAAKPSLEGATLPLSNGS
jgi:hypothetical protein